MDAQRLWESIEPPAGAAVDEKKEKTARMFLFYAIPEDVLLEVAKKKMAKEQTKNLEEMPFNEAIGRLKAYEDRLKLRWSHGSAKGTLLLTKVDSSSYKRGAGITDQTSSRGNRDFNNKDRRSRENTHVRCCNYDQYGHYASECKEKKQEEKAEVNLTRTNEEHTLLLSVCGEEQEDLVLLNERNFFPDQNEWEKGEDFEETLRIESLVISNTSRDENFMCFPNGVLVGDGNTVIANYFY
ncbi:hypothetical protein E3N88_18272 [Mikania micrantha]|uniref:CCHC-type domain-containing protein n=1 Tax=Mikania micrantha TaxID=192012 RepID=A0A5N6NUF2_9ASTR|nr:hypothetical protein E3N88_18272 [Mikania micrantha]